MVWKDVVYYDETSPSCLRWKIDVYRQNHIVCYKDSCAGFNGGELYWRVSFNRNRRDVHRIVWELHNGEIPEGMFIDHIDRDKFNNKISNLRLATHHQNNTNAKIDKRNTTSVGGVRLREYKDKAPSFVATWVEGGVQKCKSFSTSKYGYDEAFRLAVEMRKLKEKELNEKYNLLY